MCASTGRCSLYSLVLICRWDSTHSNLTLPERDYAQGQRLNVLSEERKCHITISWLRAAAEFINVNIPVALFATTRESNPSPHAQQSYTLPLNLCSTEAIEDRLCCVSVNYLCFKYWWLWRNLSIISSELNTSTSNALCSLGTNSN